MTNAGRIGFLIKGEYSPTATYDFLDVVFYDGASYVAKKVTIGNTPARSDEYWQVLAEGGTLTENSDISDTTVTFTEAENRVNVTSGDTTATIAGKIRKFFSDLKTVAFSGKYSDLTGTPGEMTGATASAAGTSGLVPGPGAGKQAAFLRGDKTWANLGAAAMLGVANNLTTTQEGFALDARQGKTLMDEVTALNSAIANMISIKIQSGIASSKHEQVIQECWDQFPDNKAFIGCLHDNNKIFITGYLYGDRKYGCVMFLTYSYQGMVICTNGVFTTKFMPNSTVRIPDNFDLNNYTSPGDYYCVSNSAAATLLNSPTTRAFTLKIHYGNGEKFPIQTIFDLGFDKYARMYNSDQKSWEQWKTL